MKQPPTTPLGQVLERRRIPVSLFAKQMGVPNTTMYRWVRGIDPPISDGLRIAEALRLPPRKLWPKHTSRKGLASGCR